MAEIAPAPLCPLCQQPGVHVTVSACLQDLRERVHVERLRRVVAEHAAIEAERQSAVYRSKLKHVPKQWVA